MNTLTMEAVFAELRSACAQKDYDKAHHCLRWFLLYARKESVETAFHYAINTVYVEMANSYKWPWWQKYIREGKIASLTSNQGNHFRILSPNQDIMFR